MKHFLQSLILVSLVVFGLGVAQQEPKNTTTHSKAVQGPKTAKAVVSSADYVKPDPKPEPKPTPRVSTPVRTPAPASYPTSHLALMKAAGIDPGDYAAVEYIVGHENRGWEPTRYNGAGSGAYGLCQALPGGKMASAGADWATNPVTQLRWCDSYAKARYGGWWPAQAFWVANQLW